MPDAITIKTTGGDIYITPDVTTPVGEYAGRILNAIDDEDRGDDWLRFNVSRGTALVRADTITGLIVQRTGKTVRAKG